MFSKSGFKNNFCLNDGVKEYLHVMAGKTNLVKNTTVNYLQTVQGIIFPCKR